MSQVTHLKSKKECESFKKNEKCIIFYSAKYCPACIEIKPLYERIANRYSNRVSFSIVDIEEARIKMDIVPIFEGYYEGEGIKRMEGVDTTSLKQFIKVMINHK
jgi:thiol-disulfide isomerase/thioredoxin